MAFVHGTRVCIIVPETTLYFKIKINNRIVQQFQTLFHAPEQIEHEVLLMRRIK